MGINIHNKQKVKNFTFPPELNISHKQPIAVYNIAVENARDLQSGMNRGRAGIYGWYNTISNKVYIGSQINLQVHPFEHLKPSNKDNVHFKRSLAKYGISSFYLVILEEIGGTLNFSLNLLEYLENDYLHLIPKKRLYNKHFGAYLTKTQHQRNAAQALRQRLSIPKQQSTPVRPKGPASPQFGTKLNANIKQKLVEQNTGRKYSSNAVGLQH